MMMKALQVVRPREFEPIQVPVPQLSSGDGEGILVRTCWGALCGSDIAFFAGNKRCRTYPLEPAAPIHECVGEVIESASDRFRPGDKVLAIPDENKGLAEIFLARASKAVVLPEEIEDFGAACLIQPLSTVMHAIDRLGDIGGKSIAVAGLGPMGLLLCWYAVFRGAGSVVGIDPCRERCRIAANLGVARTISSRSIEVVQAARLSAGEWNRPDICIEAVGHQMDTINDCLELVRKYGTVVAFGVPDQTVYALEYEVFFRKNALLMATVTPDWSDYLLRALDLYLKHKDELSPLATPRMPVREAAEAYRMYERHDEGVMKALLDMQSW
ncbi:MAG: zinc-binding dehydrogenase [Acidobacteria bacterium]|nr:zinc-binding dehydrogenase [Acidobacteriota bacterium]